MRCFKLPNVDCTIKCLCVARCAFSKCIARCIVRIHTRSRFRTLSRLFSSHVREDFGAKNFSGKLWAPNFAHLRVVHEHIRSPHSRRRYPEVSDAAVVADIPSQVRINPFLVESCRKFQVCRQVFGISSFRAIVRKSLVSFLFEFSFACDQIQMRSCNCNVMRTMGHRVQRRRQWSRIHTFLVPKLRIYKLAVCAARIWRQKLFKHKNFRI